MHDITTQRRNKGLLFPLILILAGLVFLLERSGLVDRQIVVQMLPLVPILIGSSLLVSRLRRRAG